MSPLWWLLGLVLIANLICFGLMATDKQRARARRRRIPEKTLLTSAACFGSLGGMIAMLLFRHKTLHARFAVGFPLMLGVQVVLIIFLCRML